MPYVIHETLVFMFYRIDRPRKTEIPLPTANSARWARIGTVATNSCVLEKDYVEKTENPSKTYHYS